MEDNNATENKQDVNNEPLEENEEEEQKKKKGPSVLFRIIMILLLIILIVVGTLFITVWIVDDFDSVGQLIRYIFDQI